jgi:hypothetical protein
MITLRERKGNRTEVVSGRQAPCKIDKQSESLTASGEAAEIRGWNERPGILGIDPPWGASLPSQNGYVG